MQPQQAPLIFTEGERPLGERLLKLALETDRIEGYTEPHAVMIARLAETIGAQLGLHGTDLSALKFAALAHDIGEREMKRNYLLQPNPLTWEQRLDLWRHPIIGEQAAADLQLPRQTQLLIRWHQEWWNGQGYPDGIAGTAIPLGARILRAVDTYCALISRRPYRDNYDLLDAEQIVADQAGIELDPQIVKLLLALVVAERKQREAESWQSGIAEVAEPVAAPMMESEPELEFQSQFELRRARAAEESFVTAAAAEFEPEAETLAPDHSPEADTLEMAPLVIEAQVPEAIIESPDLPLVEFQPDETQLVSEKPDAGAEPDTTAMDTSAAGQDQATADQTATIEPPFQELKNEANETQPVLQPEPETDGKQSEESGQPEQPKTSQSES
jgi:hypothetical protein